MSRSKYKEATNLAIQKFLQDQKEIKVVGLMWHPLLKFHHLLEKMIQVSRAKDMMGGLPTSGALVSFCTICYFRVS
jgi:hypothetical protein